MTDETLFCTHYANIQYTLLLEYLHSNVHIVQREVEIEIFGSLTKSVFALVASTWIEYLDCSLFIRTTFTYR